MITIRKVGGYDFNVKFSLEGGKTFEQAVSIQEVAAMAEKAVKELRLANVDMNGYDDLKARCFTLDETVGFFAECVSAIKYCHEQTGAIIWANLELPFKPLNVAGALVSMPIIAVRGWNHVKRGSAWYLGGSVYMIGDKALLDVELSQAEKDAGCELPDAFAIQDLTKWAVPEIVGKDQFIRDVSNIEGMGQLLNVALSQAGYVVVNPHQAIYGDD